jgi:polysaccharide biosynthesis transport protein
MHQFTNATTTVPVMTQAEPASGIREMVNWAIGFLRRQVVVITCITLLAISFGVIYVLKLPVSYTAEATLIIDPRRVQLFQGAAFAEGQVDTPLAWESQIELARSEPVLLSVIRDLRLTESPELVRPKGSYEGVLGLVSNFVSSTTHSGVLSEVEASRAALEVLSRNLTISRVGLSNVLSIKYRSLNPDDAIRIANAIAEAYIAEQVKGKYQSTRRVTEWLQKQIEELNRKRAAADQAVLDFKQTHNITSADGKLLNEQQVIELNSQLASARKQTSEAKARLDRTDQIIRDGAVEANAIATVADTLNNPIITQLRTRYLELVNREANWSRKYGAGHLAVVTIRNQIHDLRESMLDELRRLRESYLSNYQIAQQQEHDLEKRLAEAVSQSRTDNKAQVALRELESSAQSLRAMHDVFLQRYTESLQQQSFPISEARVFASASIPPRGDRKRALILAMAAAGGLAFGAAIGVFREAMNRSLYTREQVESALQIPCISIVPAVTGVRKSTLGGSSKPVPFSNQKLDGGSSIQKLIASSADVPWSVLESPFSHFAEAIRGIKLAIDLKSGNSSSGKVIGFTSTQPNEGKSTIALSAALLMARSGARVILVDCDLRNPALSRKLASNVGSGLLDVISGRASLNDVVWTDAFSGLRFVPAGIETHFMHSSDVLAADATRELFENLRKTYDYVLVDLSPIMPVVDARATSGFVDCYLYIVEWGRTKIDAVKYAFRDAQNLSDDLLGIVLNKVSINRLGHHYPIGENHYVNKYYKQYGLH